MFNALEYYKSGTEKLEKSKDNMVTADIKKDYNAAIDKCWKLINIHSDSNAYADDALLLIGKSHYQVEEYIKSERFLRQFVSGYQQSELLPEALLWLARSLSKLERYDEAQEFLNEILAREENSDVNSLALYTIGDIFRIQENYDSALDYFNQSVETTEDEKLAAQSLFEMGEIYTDQQHFTKSIEMYNRVKDFNAPVLLEFNANMNKVNAQIQLDQYDAALKTLRLMNNESRFLEVIAQIEAKIGEVLVLQDEFELAEEQFQNVLEKYPKTEGAAHAAFELGKLTESYRVNPDSAIILFLRVKQEFRISEYGTEAVDRANLLKDYLKIKTDINDDYRELAQLSNPDSAEVDIDTISVDSEKPSTRMSKTPKKRTEEEILASIEKNRFLLAEFFLLNMQNYDSAGVAYSDFIGSSSDTTLQAKAYYALYYLNQYQLNNYSVADSIKMLLLTQFPNSEFASYFRSLEKKTQSITEVTNRFEEKYLEAESLRLNKKYENAIRIFNEIALQDSGSKWAEMSRYSVAWIYENELNNLPKAIQAYTVIFKEYPKTEYGRIAQNKIKEPPPPPEPVTDDPERVSEVQPIDSISVSSTDTLKSESVSKDIQKPIEERKKPAEPEPIDRKIIDRELKVDPDTLKSPKSVGEER
jgi:TolA-binding protein